MNAHGQDVPHVEEREDHSNFTDHSPVLECYPCMNHGKNLPPENK